MLRLRRFELTDLDFALRQTDREGWAASRERFATHLEHDPEGCLIAEVDSRRAGMVSTTGFGTSGWIGNLIVDPKYRSRGVGRALMERGLELLHRRGVQTVRLDADPPGIPLYRSLGFVDEFESLRFVRRPSALLSDLARDDVEVMTSENLTSVCTLDRAVLGEDRSRFLHLSRDTCERAWIRRSERDTVDGYLMTFATDRGLWIGPCVASSGDDAAALVASALASAAGRPALIGVPSPNTGAIRTLVDLGFTPTPSSLRMRLGSSPDRCDPSRLVAIASGAVG